MKVLPDFLKGAGFQSKPSFVHPADAASGARAASDQAGIACFARRKRFHRGFSLVELLVTIGIIAVVVVLLLPTLNKTLEKSRSAKCIANLRQLGVGIVGFAGEHNGNLPPGKHFYSDDSGNEKKGGDVWYKDESMWAYTYITQNWPALSQIFRCPSDRTKTESDAYDYHSYTWSHYLMIHWRDGRPRPSFTAYVKLRDVQSKIVMLDGLTLGDGDPDANTSPDGPGTLTLSNAEQTIGSRHNGGANCLSGDGSVRWKPKTELVNNTLLWR